MRLGWLRPLIGQHGPYVTVYLDAAEGDASIGGHLTRWHILRKALREKGTPEAALERVEDAVVGGRGRGAQGQIIIASTDEILVDTFLDRPPTHDVAEYGPIPFLLPLARAAQDKVSYVVVTVDRAGADLRWNESSDDSVENDEANSTGEQGLPTGIDGAHDEVGRASAHGHGRDGRSRSHISARIEDSVERNAELIASEITKVIEQAKPELVLLTGDIRTVAAVRQRIGKSVAGSVREVTGGSRSPGVNPGALETAVAREVESFRQERRESVLGKLNQELGREGAGVAGIPDTIAALAQGQVRDLLLCEDVLASLGERLVWVGPDPTDIGQARASLGPIEDVETNAYELRADVALVRAAIGQDADLTVVPEGALDVSEGVAAILRWPVARVSQAS